MREAVLGLLMTRLLVLAETNEPQSADWPLSVKKFSLSPAPEHQSNCSIEQDKKVMLYETKGSHLSFVIRE